MARAKRHSKQATAAKARRRTSKPYATLSSLPPALTSSKFRFLDLPGELRNKIYDEFIPLSTWNLSEWIEIPQRKRKAPADQLWYGRRRKAKVTSPAPKPITHRSRDHVFNVFRLLHINRQIRSEAASRSFQQQTLSVSLSQIPKLTERLPPEAIAMVRRLEILDFKAVSQDTYGDPLTTQFPSLQHLCVRTAPLQWVDRTYWPNNARLALLRVQNVGWLMKNCGLQSFDLSVHEFRSSNLMAERQKAIIEFSKLKESIANMVTVDGGDIFTAGFFHPLLKLLKQWWQLNHLDFDWLVWS